MEKARSKPRERYYRDAIIYVLICCLVLNTSLPAVMALQTADVINSSGATPTQWGDHTIIRTDHGAIINWNNFNTGSGQSVTFNQYDGAGLSSQSAVLNRVSSGAVPTQFNGALNGNGRVFVVNPAGVIFGTGSTVNVSQLVASGLNMSDDAFNAAIAFTGNEMAFEGGSGVVENSGTIEAQKIYLVGKKVINRSVLRANDGLIVMAAGSNVYVAQDGSNVLVELSGAMDSTPDVMNRSAITSPNGKIVLAAGDTLSRAISNAGVITATSGSITARAARIESTGNMSADGIGGSISLTGIEQVKLDYWNTTGTGYTTASAGANGNGGTVSIQSEGTVTIAENAAVLATGGANSGDGGTINITAENFNITGEIDASPGNTDHAPGMLLIDTPNITIADGANAGEVDTIYEQDIESLSEKGTSLVVISEQGITVPSITDGEIKGRFGTIELQSTNPDGFVTFEDTTNTISTTLGHIIMGAGLGGLTIGNLETGKDISDFSPTPGQIVLETFLGGNIKTGNLLVKDGWGHAEINVNSSGDLTVNGDIIVGADSPILNIPGGQDAEAMIFLRAGNSILLDGNITARAHGLNAGVEGGITKAYIGIFSGTNDMWFGDITINGDLTAKAISSTAGTSEAKIEIDSWGTITWGPDAADPLAEGDAGEVSVQSKESDSDTNESGDVATIAVNAQLNAPQINGMPDFVTTHMGTTVEGNVLANDAHPEGKTLMVPYELDQPLHAVSFDLYQDGSFSYTPEPGYVGTDSFSYVATTEGYLAEVSGPIQVIITMTNTPPTAGPKAEVAHMGARFQSTVADAFMDPDGDSPVAALAVDALHGTVTMSSTGSYTYSPDGSGYIGDDTFTFSATDGEIGAAHVQGTITITLTNTGPAAASDQAMTSQNAPVVINVLANDSDPDGDPLKVVSFDYTGSGTIRINPDSTLTYTSSRDFVGIESFSYSMTDGQIGGTPVTATVTMTVGPSIKVPPAYFMPTGPNLDKTDVDISGCPALTRWAANEIGVDRRRIQIWIVNGLASARGIEPCDACNNLRRAATVLADPEGIYAAAIAQIIDEFGSRTNPMTEELAAYITNAMAYHGRTPQQYAKAEEYFSALSEYVGVLHNEMGFSVEKSVRIVATRYIDRLAIGGDVGVASYVAARLDSVAMFLTVVSLSQPRTR